MELRVKLYLLAMIFVFTLAVGLIGLLWWILHPYFDGIAKGIIGVAIIAACLGLFLLWNYTITRVQLWHAQVASERMYARTIIGGEVVAYLSTTDTFIHLSAQHEQAKALAQLPPPEIVESGEPADAATEETVLEMLESGISYRNIADSTHHTYYYVQSLAERNGYGKGGTGKKHKTKKLKQQQYDEPEQWNTAI